ncbi:MAG: glycosyltransferase [Bacteroidales bacterium]|nr:glycosyltransferase [Bacteroidales bacterium]
MKVLQLCNKPPYPPVDGGTMAMNSITQGLLSAGCEVKVLTVETDKHPADLEQLPADYRRATSPEAVYIDLGVKVLPAALAMLCGESYHVKRYVSTAFARRLAVILQEEQFDIVHVESIFLTPYVPLIRKYSQAKVILRAHNVEHLIWKRVAQSSRPDGSKRYFGSKRNNFKRWYLNHLSLTLRAYEMEHLQDYDGIVCITQGDADYFRDNGCRRPVTTIPFGINILEYQDAPRAPEKYSLYHLGAMDWMPNQESIAWLLDSVWPVVHREVPQAHLYLAGRKMPARLMQAHIDGVTIVGEVDDASRFIAGKQINVVPLLSGSGIRVKIIEAMSMGKAVVTTTVGARGIDYTDGVNLLIANTPDDFARQIKRLVDDPDYCRRVGEEAARLVAEQYDVRRLTDRLLQFYKERIDV